MREPIDPRCAPRVTAFAPADLRAPAAADAVAGSRSRTRSRSRRAESLAASFTARLAASFSASLAASLAAGGAVLLALLCASPAAMAQYKYVSPDGTVTYSDRLPPPDARNVTSLHRPAPPDPAAQLPYEARRAARRNPVTLYTTRDCLPCQAARDHLTRRGVPFAERLVNTAADMQRFQELGFRNSFPALAIGEQKVFGYQNAELDSLLDTAGYPESVKLPVAMQRAQPQPLAGDTPPVPRAGEQPGGETVPGASNAAELAQTGADGASTQDRSRRAAQTASSDARTTGPRIRF